MRQNMQFLPSSRLRTDGKFVLSFDADMVALRNKLSVFLALDGIIPRFGTPKNCGTRVQNRVKLQ